jgi:hypothetical protein
LICSKTRLFCCKSGSTCSKTPIPRDPAFSMRSFPSIAKGALRNFCCKSPSICCKSRLICSRYSPGCCESRATRSIQRLFCSTPREECCKTPEGDDPHRDACSIPLWICSISQGFCSKKSEIGSNSQGAERSERVICSILTWGGEGNLGAGDSDGRICSVQSSNRKP